MAHQPIKPMTYGIVYVVLLLLTATTVYVAKYMHLGQMEVAVALGIAGTKTVLIGLIFMHLIYSKKLTWLVIAGGILFLVAMMAFTLSDYWTRGWMPVRGVPVGWLLCG